MQSFIQDPRNHAFLVYDRASEQVAGFSAWTAPSGSRYARDISVWTRVRFNINRWLAALIPSSIVGLCERLIYGVERARARQAVRDRKRAWAVFVEDANRRFIRPEHRQQGYWHLSLLGVLPEFGRQGVAQRLLAWGMERADEEDGPIYLSASAQGLGAYQKSGFVEVGRDICYPEDPLGGWPEIVCMRERLSERAVASPEGLQSTTT